ncbi:MAG: PorV/PorQ family protein [Elusimicrobiota bacterium]|jgi:hypothetical protein
MRLLLQLLALYSGGLPAYAGTVPATHFLSRGPGAQAAALAGAVESSIADPTALYWNPAGLAHSGGTVSGEHLFLLDGARYNFIGLTVPSKPGTFGLGAIQLNRGNIVSRSTIDDPGTTVSATQSDYMLGFARSLGERWSAGITANVLDYDLAGYKDRGFGFDAGLKAAYPGEDILGLRQTSWSLGLTTKNLLEPHIKLSEETETLPREFRAGAGLSFALSSRASKSGLIRHDLGSVFLSLRKVMGVPEVNFGLGLSCTIQKMLILRAGFDNGISGGLGFLTGDGKFSVDYALEDKPMSLNHRFTLSYRFIEPKTVAPAPTQEEQDEEFVRAQGRAKALSDEFYAKAQEKLKEASTEDAVELFELASLMLPEDAERSAAYKRVLEIQRREKIKALTDALDSGNAMLAGHEEDGYRLIARLLDLRPTDRDEQARMLAKLTRRMEPEAFLRVSQEVLAEKERDIAGLREDGRLADAERTVSDLALLQSTATASEVSRLRREIAEQGTALRRKADELAAKSPRSAKALAAALALSRAYPQDAALAGRLQSLRKEYVSGLGLTLKERLHLRKLYYLAAVRCAKRADDEARDLANEILRRNASDADALALLERLDRSGPR